MGAVARLWAAALAHHQAGRLVEAASLYQRVADATPGHASSLHHLGIVRRQQGLLKDAVAAFERALAIKPDLAEAHVNLGGALAAQGRLEEAVSCHLRALALKPDLAAVHANLGHLRMQRGEFDQATAHYRQALAIEPKAVELHVSLGIAWRKLGRFDEAAQCHRRALGLDPDCAAALHDLAAVCLARGDLSSALVAVRRALSLREAPETRSLFVQCIRGLVSAPNMDGLRGLLVRALAEAWQRPCLLAQVSANVLKQDPQIREMMRRVVAAWPARLSARDLFSTAGITTIMADRLLQTLLESTQVSDGELEQFLTAARHAALEIASETASAAADDLLAFCGALARQCWINEYVFALADGELDRAMALRDAVVAALRANVPVPSLRLAVVACYVPLLSLEVSELLLDRSWPDSVAGLIIQQVREPQEEQRLAAAMPCLTAIDDKISVLVRRQYEEHPYPRWMKQEPAREPPRVDAWLRQTFPAATVDHFAARTALDVLVAGCGTGQSSVAATRWFAGTQVLAVDLSLASLAYAERKTRELGINNVVHAQADILGLASIGRSFDVIEVCGVLHHLADWRAGWRILLSLLRPGGLMRVGLYSERARRCVVAARAFVAERGYGRTAADIRRCRQDMLAAAEPAFADVLKFQDFFTTSECRDLLFHVQEHRLTLAQIKAFLRDNDLRFLGFAVDAGLIDRFKRRFPGGASLTDLDLWDVLESENPMTFVGMYQFWVQKV